MRRTDAKRGRHGRGNARARGGALFPVKSSESSQMPTTQSARMSALRHVLGSPSLKLIDASDSMIVAGHSELPVTPLPCPSAAAPSAHIVIPNLEM